MRIIQKYEGNELVDDEGRLIRFSEFQVPGRGWTVVKTTGTRKTGRFIEVLKDFEDSNYTMHQAQVAAENRGRDVRAAVRMGQIEAANALTAVAGRVE
jgi:hypothetical protein